MFNALYRGSRTIARHENGPLLAVYGLRVGEAASFGSKRDNPSQQADVNLGLKSINFSRLATFAMVPVKQAVDSQLPLAIVYSLML